jgi:hypothetical protein
MVESPSKHSKLSMARAGRLVRGWRKQHHHPSFGVRLLQTLSSVKGASHAVPNLAHLSAYSSCTARSLPTMSSVVCLVGGLLVCCLPSALCSVLPCLHARAHRSGIFRPSSLADSCPLAGADTQMRRQLCSTVDGRSHRSWCSKLSKGGAKRKRAAPDLASGLGCVQSHPNPTVPFAYSCLCSGLSDSSVDLFGCDYVVSFAPKARDGTWHVGSRGAITQKQDKACAPIGDVPHPSALECCWHA